MENTKTKKRIKNKKKKRAASLSRLALCQQYRHLLFYAANPHPATAPAYRTLPHLCVETQPSRRRREVADQDGRGETPHAQLAVALGHANEGIGRLHRQQPACSETNGDTCKYFEGIK